MAQINWTNVTSFAGLLTAANTATSSDGTGGIFWTAISYFIFIIIILIGIDWGLEVALLIAAVTASVISIPLLYAGLIENWVIGSYVGIVILTMFSIIWGSRSDN